MDSLNNKRPRLTIVTYDQRDSFLGLIIKRDEDRFLGYITIVEPRSLNSI
jgi:hypothetical protein